VRYIFSVILTVIISVSAYQIASSLPVEYDSLWVPVSGSNQSTEFSQFITDAQIVIRTQLITSEFANVVAADSAVIISDTSSSLTVGYGADKQLEAASLYKLFTAYLTLQDIDSGEITSRSRVDGRTVGICLNLSITISDNNCANALAERIGWDVIDQRLADAGYNSTVLNNYNESGELLEDEKLTTAGDVALLLRRLYDGVDIQPQSRQLLLDLLAEQTINDRIPTEVPETVVFLHKTGNLLTTAHDAGFIINSSGDAFIFVIMTDNWEDDAYTQSPELFQDLLQQIVQELEL